MTRLIREWKHEAWYEWTVVDGVIISFIRCDPQDLEVRGRIHTGMTISSTLKSPGVWISLASALLGLLVSDGIVGSGSTLQTIAASVISLVGILTGHAVAGSSATTPAA